MSETPMETKWKRRNEIRFHRFPQDAQGMGFLGVKFFFVSLKWKRTGNELEMWKRTRNLETNWKRICRA
jgi:hypothetical protein